MEFISEIPLVGSVLSVVIGTLLPFLAVLGVVVFVHEYGHYIVGRWCGVEADVFSLGFGPEAFGWTDTHGTRWKVCWIPLGGYVKFKGDANAASAPSDAALEGLSAAERRKTLPGAPIWARSLTVAAGPAANFLLTFVLVALLGLAFGRASDAPVIGAAPAGGQAAGAGFLAGDRLVSVDGAPVTSFTEFQEAMLSEAGRPREVQIERGGAPTTLVASFTRPPVVSSVTPGGAAEAACVRPGDVILAIDGAPIASFSELQAAVSASDGAPLELTIQRDADLITTVVTPKVMETPVDATSGLVERRLLIGVTADFNIGLGPTSEAMGVGEALAQGAGAPLRIAAGTFGYLGQWISGDADGSSMSGPIGIASASGQMAQAGFLEFISFIALVSTAIGLINLFPIPILDGGHLVFYAIEAVRGRPLSERATEIAMTIGLGAILLLLVFATSNDVARSVGGLVAAC